MSNSGDEGAAAAGVCVLCLLVTVFLILCTPITVMLMIGSYASAGASTYGFTVSVDRVQNLVTDKNCSSAYTESGIVVAIAELENGNYRVFVDLYDDGKLVEVGKKYVLTQYEIEKYNVTYSLEHQEPIPMYQRCDVNCEDAQNDDDVYDCKHLFYFERQKQQHNEIGYIFLALFLIIASLVLVILAIFFTVLAGIGTIFWTIVIASIVSVLSTCCCGLISYGSFLCLASTINKVRKAKEWIGDKFDEIREKLRGTVSEDIVDDGSVEEELSGDVETGSVVEEELSEQEFSPEYVESSDHVDSKSSDTEESYFRSSEDSSEESSMNDDHEL